MQHAVLHQRRILYLHVSGSEFTLHRYSRRLLHLHVTSSAFLRLRCSRLILHLRVVSDNNREVLQLVVIFLDLCASCMQSRFLHGIDLFIGILIFSFV